MGQPCQGEKGWGKIGSGGSLLSNIGTICSVWYFSIYYDHLYIIIVRLQRILHAFSLKQEQKIPISTGLVVK
jgi:hypothetical protein